MSAANTRPGRPSVVLLLICLALGWLVYEALGAKPRQHRPVSGPAGKTATVEPPPPLPSFTMPDLGQLATTIERPLFMPTRRPPPPEEVVKVEVKAPAPAPVPLEPLKVGVSGLIISDSERLALLRRESGGDLLRMAIGDTIDGWTVKDIQADGVIFDRDGETTEVKLRDLKPGQSRKASRPTKKPPRNRRRTRSRRSEPKTTTPAAKSTSPRSRANRER